MPARYETTPRARFSRPARARPRGIKRADICALNFDAIRFSDFTKLEGPAIQGGRFSQAVAINRAEGFEFLLSSLHIA